MYCIVKMKKIFTLALLLAFCAAMHAKDYEYASVANDPMGVRIYTLDNGLKVYFSVNKDAPRITAFIAVNTGSRNDPAEYTGLAHYLEHLMFKGSKKMGTADYEKEKPYIDKITALYEEYGALTDSLQRRQKYHEIDSVSQIAAQYNIPNEYDKLMSIIGSEGTNAFTSFDMTCYTEDIPSNEIERWAKAQADRFQNLVMRGFHTELEAVYEEKNIAMGSDGEKTFDALMMKAFPSHSYGTQTTLGTQEHLKSPSLVAIQAYYEHYYVPNNIAIVMAGDFDPDETIALLDKHFGSWISTSDAKAREFEPQPVFTTPQDTIVVGQETEGVLLGWRFKGANSLQSDTLQVLSKVLSNGKAGLIDLDINQKITMLGASAGAMNLKDYGGLLLMGLPKQGQSLEEVRSLLLAEVEKVKRGEFDERLLMAINNNEKLNFLRGLDNNRNRVMRMVNSFIDDEPWAQCVGAIERQGRITKADIVAFANKYLTNGYVVVERHKGVDTSIKKIDKPEITPIPSNRDLKSDFLTELASETVEPIHPEFVDFNKELTFYNTAKGLPVIYKQNKENDLFTLQFRYDFGSQADTRYETAFDYVELLGTKTLSAEEIQTKFYSLACNYSLSVGASELSIGLSGLQENMAEALSLLDELLQNAVADEDVYKQLVEQTLKAREDEKLEQRPGAQHLFLYGLNGERNRFTTTLTSKELKDVPASGLIDLVKGLSGIKHTILYYGPAAAEELSTIVTNAHTVAPTLQEPPKNVPFEWLKTTTSDVLIAPYEANNIYMYMLSQEDTPFDVKEWPTIRLFNEYFGSGMNSVVFQELRETKGLAYSANAIYRTPSEKEDPCYMTMNIITQNDKMMDCINAFSDITSLSTFINEAAVDIARASLMKYIASKRTTKFNVLNLYLSYKKLGIDYDVEKLFYEQLPKLHSSDLLEFAKKYIINKPLRYMILGNEKELDMQALEKIGPIKRLSIDDIYVK